jgi:hypothetical protein
MSMSSVTHFYCDRCGQPITEGRAVLSLAVGQAPNWAVDAETARPTIDWCEGCFRGLQAWLLHREAHRPVIMAAGACTSCQ